MRAMILLAGAALSLTACGGEADDAANDVDTLQVNNLVVDNATVGTDMNMDANMSMNSDTHNAMMNDLATNDADTNLANGM